VHGPAVSLDERVDPVEEGHRGAMAVLAPQERPGFADHQVAGEHLFGSPERGEHAQGIVVPGVPGQRPRHPPAGVGELHRP
jgi:hypothetical protein